MEDDSAGELVRKIKEFQYIDWTDLRFSPRASEKYQRGISEMASRLIKANENLLKASKGNNDVNKVPEKTRDVIREGDSEDEQAYGFLEYDVIQVNGDRAVIGIGNTVTSAIDVRNIERI